MGTIKMSLVEFAKPTFHKLFVCSDVISIYLFLSFTAWSTGTLLSFWRGDFPWVDRFQRFLGNSTEALWKLSHCGGPIAGGLDGASVFHKTIVSNFYLAIFSDTD